MLKERLIFSHIVKLNSVNYLLCLQYAAYLIITKNLTDHGGFYLPLIITHLSRVQWNGWDVCSYKLNFIFVLKHTTFSKNIYFFKIKYNETSLFIKIKNMQLQTNKNIQDFKIKIYKLSNIYQSEIPINWSLFLKIISASK